MNKETLSKSIAATLANGRRLLADADFLFDFDRFSTALSLAVLAQEEFAKAFLLQLVADEALPWEAAILRSMTKHQCKHLLALVMEWIPLFDVDSCGEWLKCHTEKMAWLQRWSDRSQKGHYARDLEDDPEPIRPDVLIPSDVADALNIYRHEEIERLSGGDPWKDDDWKSGKARQIASGSLDKKKQSGFYVNITKTGEIGLHPGLITREEALGEIERAKRLADGPERSSDEYRKLKEILPFLFSDATQSDKGG